MNLFKFIYYSFLLFLKENLIPFEFRYLSLTNLLNFSPLHLTRSLNLSERSFALASKLIYIGVFFVGRVLEEDITDL